MATSDTGAGENLAQRMVEQVITGGATVHLYGGGATANYSDTSTEISSKSDATVQVAEADWTITTPADFSGTVTIENNNELNFGSLDIGVVDQVVIQNDVNADDFVLAQEPNDPNLTGESVSISAGTTIYEFGNA